MELDIPTPPTPSTRLTQMKWSEASSTATQSYRARYKFFKEWFPHQWSRQNLTCLPSPTVECKCRINLSHLALISFHKLHPWVPLTDFEVHPPQLSPCLAAITCRHKKCLCSQSTKAISPIVLCQRFLTSLPPIHPSQEESRLYPIPPMRNWTSEAPYKTFLYNISNLLTMQVEMVTREI